MDGLSDVYRNLASVPNIADILRTPNCGGRSGKVREVEQIDDAVYSDPRDRSIAQNHNYSPPSLTALTEIAEKNEESGGWWVDGGGGGGEVCVKEKHRERR